MASVEAATDPDQPNDNQTSENAAAESERGSEKIRRKPERKNKFTEIPTRLASKLRQIRINKNLTQGKMLLIVSPLQNSEDNRPRISQFEKGKRIPSLIEIWRYAKFYGVTMEDLVDDSIDLPDK